MQLEKRNILLIFSIILLFCMVYPDISFAKIKCCKRIKKQVHRTSNQTQTNYNNAVNFVKKNTESIQSVDALVDSIVNGWFQTSAWVSGLVGGCDVASYKGFSLLCFNFHREREYMRSAIDTLDHAGWLQYVRSGGMKVLVDRSSAAGHAAWCLSSNEAVASQVGGKNGIICVTRLFYEQPLYESAATLVHESRHAEERMFVAAGRPQIDNHDCTLHGPDAQMIRFLLSVANSGAHPNATSCDDRRAALTLAGDIERTRLCPAYRNQIVFPILRIPNCP